MNAGVACFSAFFLGLSLGLINSNIAKSPTTAVKNKKKRKKKKTTKPEEQKEDLYDQNSPKKSIPKIFEEDLQMLSEIYQDDLIMLSKPNDKENKFKIFLFPIQDQTEINCSLFLSVTLPSKYPQTLPIFDIIDPVGIPNEFFFQFKEKLKQKTSKLFDLSKPIIHGICDWLIKKLIQINPSPASSPNLSYSEMKIDHTSENSEIGYKQIKDELSNRKKQSNKPLLLNSVNNIKTIEKYLLDSSYKIPQKFTGFDYKSYFEEVEMIGKGGGGVVFKVINNIDGCYYAVKIINLKGQKDSHVKNIMKEVLVLSRLQHQNIVRYHNAWFEEDSDDEKYSEDEEESDSEEFSDESSISDN